MAGFVPPATTGDVGAVQPDGTTILVDVDGTIRAHVATTTAPGIVQPDGEVITILDGVITVPLATPVALGVVMPDGVTIIEPIPGQIAAATATTGQLGVVQPDGTSIDVDGAGIISTAPLHITDGTHDVHPTRQVTFADATVSGTAPDAIVTPHTATTARLGIVQPDGSSILVDGAGVISAADQGVAVTEDDITIYQATKVRFADAHVTGPAPNVLVTPHTATTGQLGVVQPDGTTIVVDGAGVISAAPPEPLLSIVDGDGTRVDGVLILLVPDSTVAVTPAVSGGATLTINEASDSHLGLAQADGTTITASGGVLSATAVGLPAGAQGDIAHHGASVWGALPAGDAGDVLTSDGTDVSYQPARVAIAADATVAGTRHEIDVQAGSDSLVVSATDDSGADAVHVAIDLSDSVKGALAALGTTTAFISAAGSGKVHSVGVGGTPPAGWQARTFDDSAWAASVAQGGGTWTAIPGSAWITYQSGVVSPDDIWLFRLSFVLPAGTVTAWDLSAIADMHTTNIYMNGALIYNEPSTVDRGPNPPPLYVAPANALLIADGTTANVLAIQVRAAARTSPAVDTSLCYVMFVVENSAQRGMQGVIVAEDATVAGTEPEINFIPGANITIAAVDNAANNRVDVTITGSGGGGGAASADAYQAGDNANVESAGSFGAYPNTPSLTITVADSNQLRFAIDLWCNSHTAGSTVQFRVKCQGAGAGGTVYATFATYNTNGVAQAMHMAADTAPLIADTYTCTLEYETVGGGVYVRAATASTGEYLVLSAEWSSGSGGSGGSITVEDGTHTVASATAIEFTGATVSGSTPTADVTIPDLAASGSGHHAGMAPDPGATAGSMKFLREDATWAVPGVAASLTVDDGTTTVEGVASLSFSGASVAAAGAGATVIIVPTISHGSASLLAPVTLSQGEFTEVLSLTRPAGTWLYFAGITLAAAADCDMYALIYDGTTDRGSAVISLKAGQAATLSIVSDPITLASEGAISLQAYVPADTADGTAQATAPTVPLSTLTYLRCMRVG